MDEIAPGIYRWSAPHPEYRPRVEEVVSFALVCGDTLAIVDPLLPAAGDARREPLLAALDELVSAAQRLDVMITIPFHTRSAQSLVERYSSRRPTLLWGHALVQKRLTGAVPLEIIPRRAAGEAAVIAAGAAAAYTIGKPRRSEPPLLRRATRRGVRRRRRGHRRRPALLEPSRRHRRGVVPRRLRPHPARARRAAHRAPAGHPRGVGSRGRAASARRVPRRPPVRPATDRRRAGAGRFSRPPDVSQPSHRKKTYHPYHSGANGEDEER